MSATTTPPAATPTQSAPSRSDLINTWGRVVISVVVLVLFAAVSTLVLTHTIPASESATMVVGAVLAMATSVVGYWIGSSAGSTAKSAQMAAMTPPPAPGTTTTTTGTTIGTAP